MAPAELSEIYLITCRPSGKQYVGQYRIVSKRVSATMQRWRSHISDMKREGGGNCTLLNAAMRKYGLDAFDVEALLVCSKEHANYWEDYFMDELNTLAPHGYNLRRAGNHGKLHEYTRALMSEVRRQNPPFKGKSHTEDVKRLIAQMNIDRTIRHGHHGQPLPKYMKYVNWKDRRGYQVLSHPKGKNRYFVYTDRTVADVDLDQKCTECLEYLDYLNTM